MGRVVRTGVSFPVELLKEFDEVARRKGYRKRSQAICDAIRSFIVEHAWEAGGDNVLGVISLVYDHGKGMVADQLLDVEHAFQGLITSSLHVHLDENNCLEVLVSKGPAVEIRKLADHLMSIRGVKNVKLLTTALTK
ncbi:MAG: nickel-responsive transcriptional regulator NikR [Candidatus Nezhaarchaeales archaeon]